MLSIISPAKTLNFKAISFQESTVPVFLSTTNYLLGIVKNYSQEQLTEIMNISSNLAQLNRQRFQNFEKQELKQAIFAYDGDVYNNIKVEELKYKQLNFLQSHLLIISGLYGVLRPLDVIRPYRLEMATKLPDIKNLADFWQEKITSYINQTLEQHKNKYLLNLASIEYSSAIAISHLQYPMINVFFKENKNGKLQTIGINAKKARGNMVNFIATNSIDNPCELKNFSYLNYKFSVADSSENNLVFIK
ncbi:MULTISPECIES: YaaA family protein [unclassified Rickettsia]|uniref:YaaA family protein n=1 Tax=unclassified Rickettsia TaxID=114295 RepID=UPI00209E92C5|nr:YaaA family protein [Rickettsia endosymbiont of Ceutorhynchus assimilis]